MLTSPPETRSSLLLRLPNAADSAAWDEVVGVYGPLVYRLALSRGLQPSDADDLVQEVFTAVAKQITDWLERPQRGRFRAWLLRIARNIAINLLTRKPLGTTGVGGDADWALRSLPDSGQLSSQFDIKYQQEVICWAADQIRGQFTEKTWLAFELTHLQGVSIKEAAQRLEMSEGGIYIARSRVVNRLREVAKQFEINE